jgi:hypothetical protein
MSTLSKAVLQAMRADLDKALADVAKKHGLQSLRSGNCTFNPDSGNFTMKVEGIAQGGTDKKSAAEAAEYDMYRDFKPELPPRGSKFEHSGKRHEVIGCNRGCTKIITRASDGKKYQFQTAGLVALVARQSA